MSNEGGVDYFRMREHGDHAGPVYGQYAAKPIIYSIDSLLKYSPLDYLELALGFRQLLPSPYTRFTYAASTGNLATAQEYHLNTFTDYTLGLRLRHEPIEVYLDILEKTQRDDWNAFPTNKKAAQFFTYIRAHYEENKLGLRYVSGGGNTPERSNLSLLIGSLLDRGQLNMDAGIQYRKGAVRTNIYNYSMFTAANFYTRLTTHLSPALVLGYGLNKNLGFETGLTYTTPFQYQFTYMENAQEGYNLLNGEYAINRNFQVPLSLRYRPQQDMEWTISSPIAFARQKLNYSARPVATGIITDFPVRELLYFNTRPELTLSYLHDNNKKIEPDTFSFLTKNLLKLGQFLIRLTYLKDVTTLDKKTDNGPQNMIDPYNVFLYPMDFFVAGTEFAAFYTGNSARTATNIGPQNYYLCQAAFTYGLNDRLNAGFRIGYHSSSSLHHFTLGDLNQPYELKSRWYKFKPYYFFDLLTDWRASRNSIFSFVGHYVPRYATIVKIDGLTKEFNEDARYFDLALRYKVLF